MTEFGMINKQTMMIRFSFFLFLLPVMIFAQSKEYRQKSKSGSYSFLTEKNELFYLKDIIREGVKLGYELIRDDDGDIIYEGYPQNFILLKKSIDKDDFFPSWSVGDIYKKIFFFGKNLEDAIKGCVITEIQLSEYSNVSASRIKEFYNSLIKFKLEHIQRHFKVISSDFNLEEPLKYLSNTPKYTVSNKLIYSKDEFENYLEYSQTSKTVRYNDGRLGTYHYLGFQHNDELWVSWITGLKAVIKKAENKDKIIKKLRGTIGDLTLEEINTYDLGKMIQFFLEDCKRSNIIVPDFDTVTATFEPLGDGILAMAYGMNNDSQIIIKVDPTNWQNSDLVKKWYVLYHELGHDVFNLEHGEGGKMMFNFADKEYSWDEFYNNRDYMFNYLLQVND